MLIEIEIGCHTKLCVMRKIQTFIHTYTLIHKLNETEENSYDKWV